MMTIRIRGAAPFVFTVTGKGNNNQHTNAMMLLSKEHAQSSGLGPSSYAPIAKALTVLPEEALETLRKKLHIAILLPLKKLLSESILAFVN